MIPNQFYEELEQYDYCDGEYLAKVAKKYFPLIGEFLISFSNLEQELNLAIADCMSDRCHEAGFVIIEKLNFINKIDLFYKLYARLESVTNKRYKEILDQLRKRLAELNKFRNSIVHASWQSLTKDGSVRTKIVVDNDEGFVKFKRVLMNSKIIRRKISEVGSLANKIDQYKEKILIY